MANDSSNKKLRYITLEDAARKELRYIKGRMEGNIKSLLTPWNKFNIASMNGIEWGSIITIAGMSGSGKTAVLNELETGLFERNPYENFAVLSFNFEMAARRLVGRKISKAMNFTVKQMYNADLENPHRNFTVDNYNQAVEYLKTIKNFPVYYVDIPGTVQEIVNTVEHFAMIPENLEKGILVTLDHSILVKKFGEQTTLQVLYELAAAFNELKKKIKVSFIIVSQLNRGIENVERIQNKNLHFPMKSDVFGADALYQYSDVFMITHRPDMLKLETYGPTDLPVKDLIYWHYLKHLFLNNDNFYYLYRMNIEKDGKPAIYKIVNITSDKIYIGSCVGHYRRKAQHWWRLRQKTHDNNHLQSAWNKYGEENFKFVIIEFVENTNNLINREQYWLDVLNVCNPKIGYNKAPRAGSNLGRKMSLESRQKMSASKKGVKHDPEVAKRRGLSNRKQILQFSKENIFIKEFNGIIEASNILNIRRDTISKALSSNYSHNKTAGGFIWKYKSEAL